MSNVWFVWYDDPGFNPEIKYICSSYEKAREYCSIYLERFYFEERDDGMSFYFYIGSSPRLELRIEEMEVQ